MAWVSQQPWQPDGTPQLRFCQPGGWRVASFELAPQTAHIHANVLKAVRAAEQDNPDLRVQGHILSSRYQGPHNKRLLPCRLLSREALIATFKHLHGVPACRDIRAVLRQYLELFDETDAGEPAPDSEIRPPDPEPADTLLSELGNTLEPVLLCEPRVAEAIDLLAEAGAPERSVREIRDWDSARRFEQLQRRARSWAEVGEIFHEHQVREARG